MRQALAGLLEILFPPACAACGALLPAPQALCGSCDAELERLPDDRCAVCAEPGSFAGQRCGRCVRAPPPFRGAFAPFLHEGPVARAVHRFKYEDQPHLAPALAELLANEATDFLERAPAFVCEVPLHVSRYRSRRYDQAGLLAAELARRTRRTLLPRALERTRATARQVGLHEAARLSNLQGAFRAPAPLAYPGVLLVDDVLTTGATVSDAARALLAAGVDEVYVLTLSRAQTL